MLEIALAVSLAGVVVAALVAINHRNRLGDDNARLKEEAARQFGLRIEAEQRGLLWKNEADRLKARRDLWQEAARKCHWRAKVSKRHADAARKALLHGKALDALMVRP